MAAPTETSPVGGPCLAGRRTDSFIILDIVPDFYYSLFHFFISGFYCPVASGQPRPCPQGFFGSRPLLHNLSQCSACEEGYYCPHPGLNSSFAKCHAGFYCSEGSNTAQPINETFGDKCPTGHYCPDGSAVPVPCEPG